MAVSSPDLTFSAVVLVTGLDLAVVVPLGLLLGVAVTLLGGGGGVWYLLVLLAFDVPYRVAVPTSLATVLLTTAFGSLGHLREGRVAVRPAVVVVAGAVVGTGVGVRIVSRLPTAVLERLFGAFLLVAAGLVWVLTDPDEERSRWVVPARLRDPVAAIVGLLTGVASAVFGISGTPVLLPGLALLGLSATSVVGTSVVAILGTAIAGVAWYERLAAVDWSLALPFGLAAGAGAFAAPRLYRVLPDEERLERGYRVVFTLVAAGAGVAFLW